MAVRWYVAYALSYRDIEELMNERGVKVDHATVQRWVVEYSLTIELHHIIWKGQLKLEASTRFEQFYALAG